MYVHYKLYILPNAEKKILNRISERQTLSLFQDTSGYFGILQDTSRRGP